MSSQVDEFIFQTEFDWKSSNCISRSLMEISQVQYGFMPDRGTRNAIFVLRRLVERSIQKQKDVFTCFIDYSKA